MGSSSDLFASGGKLVIEIITASKVWTPPQALLDKGGVVTAELVGGGGGGGGGALHNLGGANLGAYGGSGAGGWRVLRQTVVATAINAVIGAGGIGGAPSTGATPGSYTGTAGQAGGTTSFNGITAPGGGGGGGGNAYADNSGSQSWRLAAGGGGGTHGAVGANGTYSEAAGGQAYGGYPGGYSGGTVNGNPNCSGAGAGAGGPAFSATAGSNIFRLSMPGPGINGYGIGGPSSLFGSVGWADAPANTGNGGGGGYGNQKGWNGGSGVLILSYVV